jgi:hypothetical protein
VVVNVAVSSALHARLRQLEGDGFVVQQYAWTNDSACLIRSIPREDFEIREDEGRRAIYHLKS